MEDSMGEQNRENSRAWEIMETRHSVRQFTDREIGDEPAALLEEKIAEIQEKSGLVFVLKRNEPNAFRAEKLHYGSFRNCRNYFALYGGDGDDEKIGYYGEELVLYAQELGLNTCWVALTYDKKSGVRKAVPGKKLFDLIALGYGQTQGVPHKSKAKEKLTKITEDSPAWFLAGVDAALLAPTAINQQRFYLEQTGPRAVKAKRFFGPCSKVDLGIVKYHFELGAGKENFDWA